MFRFVGPAESSPSPALEKDSPSTFDSVYLTDFSPPSRSTPAIHSSPLVARLNRLRPLTMADAALLEMLVRHPTVRPAHHILFHEDVACDHVCVLLEGVACRYRMLAGGRRQILGYVLPGDVCDLQFLTSGPPDHGVSLLTPALMVKISRPRLTEVMVASPAIKTALRLSTEIDKAILRQWLLNIGQRCAVERMSHFLSEYVVRMEEIGEIEGAVSVPFGINQVALADTLGMTAVHVNRTLQSMRADGLIVLRQRRLIVPDRERLAAAGSFDPGYLHLRKSAG